MNLVFDKDDKFIEHWIQENIEEYDDKQELNRFQELYNAYMDGDMKWRMEPIKYNRNKVI